MEHKTFDNGAEWFETENRRNSPQAAFDGLFESNSIVNRSNTEQRENLVW